MRIKIHATIWRIAIIVMTVLVWVSVVAAQEEVQATTKTTSLAPVLIVILTGFAAVAALGMMMYMGDSGTRSDSN